MKPDRAIARLASVAFLCCAPSLSAQVSKSLQERVDDLEPGAALELGNQKWAGPLKIDKSCTIRGRGAVIEGPGTGHVIHVVARNVQISGLTVQGSGLDLSKDHAGIMIEGSECRVSNTVVKDSLHGIYLKKVDRCRIENCKILGKTQKLVPVDSVIGHGLKPLAPGLCSVKLNINQRGNGIHLWNSSDNIVVGNEIKQTRDGIYFSFSNRNKIRKNHIHNLRYGLHYMYSDDNSFRDNHFNGNAAGAALMYSEGIHVENNRFVNNTGHRAYGLLMQSVDRTAVIDNVIRNNTVGLYLENSNDNRFRYNSLTDSYIGIRLTRSSRENAFTRNRFERNLHAVEMSTTNEYNQWAVDGVGNYWGSGVPLDIDGDGVGELAHRETDLLGRYRGEFKLVGLLSRSPFLDLVGFVHSRANLPGVPAIRDPAPLSEIPEKEEP